MDRATNPYLDLLGGLPGNPVDRQLGALGARISDPLAHRDLLRAQLRSDFLMHQAQMQANQQMAALGLASAMDMQSIAPPVPRSLPHRSFATLDSIRQRFNELEAQHGPLSTKGA